jgi:hypothetical protein
MATPKFKPGQSGNPAGRPAGKTPGAKLRKAIEQRADDILQSLIDAAVGGDTTAAKVLIDKLIPNLKPIAGQVTITLPDGAGLAEQGAAVIQAALNGSIPPDIGSQLITALAAQSKIIEIDELTKRIEALEGKQQ